MNITGDQAVDKVLPHLEKKTTKALSILSTVLQQTPATVSSSKVLGIFVAISNALPVLLAQTAPLENGKLILSRLPSFRMFRRRVQQTEGFVHRRNPGNCVRSAGVQCRVYCAAVDDRRLLRGRSGCDQFDRLISAKKEKFQALHKLVTEDHVLTLTDAQDIKVEAADHEAGSKTPAVSSMTAEHQAQQFLKSLDQEVDALSENEGLLKFYRKQFLTMLQVLLYKVKAKVWTRSHLMDFAKEMYLNRRGFFNREQEELLSNILDDSASQSSLLSRRIIWVTAGNVQLAAVRDGNTLSNPLQARHEVTDNREWKLAGDGMDKWANRQFTH